ncbi:MAG: hypothetical protein HY063_06100, partial [Bacteroidetes bacterium]|nr:hypothetical protein [Bacteroidota bacterium]
MSTRAHGRIPTSIPKFHDYVDDTDDYQTQNNRYLTWGWTQAESQQWTAFRNIDNPLYLKWIDKKVSRTTDITTLLKQNIKNCLLYDHDKTIGHKLLDKVGAFGSVADCEKFHVKRGTVLADSTRTQKTTATGKEPELAVKKTMHLLHTLEVHHPNKKGKGNPDDVKATRIYTAITADSNVPSADQFKYMGDAKRGFFTVHFEDKDLRKVAWHSALYEDSKGNIGEL